MFDQDHSGLVDIFEFDKLYAYINQWLNVFKSFDRDSSGHIEEQELTQGKYLIIMFYNAIITFHHLSCVVYSSHSDGFPVFTQFHQVPGIKK